MNTMIAAVAALVLSGSVAIGQNTPDQRQTGGGKGGGASPGAVELDRDPTRLESIGLELNLPLGVKAESVRYGSSSSSAVTLPDGLGILLIKEQKTTREDLDAAGVLDGIRRQLVGALGFELIERVDDLRIGVWRGSRLYVRKAVESGGFGFRGVTVFKLRPRAFLIFDQSFSGSAQGFTRSRRLTESIIATMNLDAVAGESLQRAAGLRSTEALLDQLTFEDYEAVLTGRSGERWERLYTPGQTGEIMDDAEHGYRRIRSWAGYKGELRTEDRSEWSDEERELGYVLQIDAMALEPSLRVDSRSVFFVSLDGNEETWTIRMSLTQNGEKTVSTATGVRVGDQLTVSTVQGREPTETVRPVVPGTGYVAQAKTYMLGHLIVHKGLVGDFASYAFNSTTSAVSLRWDRVSRSGSDPDRWVVRTKLTPKSPVSETEYGKDGGLLRVTLANGRVWEPTTLGSLVDLWERKGLPLR